MKQVVWLMIALFSVVTFKVDAVQDVHQFSSADDKALYKELIDQLRCPKCQNQNIADSNANIAKDLRAKVYKLVNEGKSKDQVVDYMVERYGYFVYYKPPLTGATVILWLLPIGFILLTLLIIWRKSNLSLRMVDEGDDNLWSDEQEQQLNALIAKIEQGSKG